MRYLGIDQSLSDTGLVVVDEAAQIVAQKALKTEPKNFKCDIERLIFIRDEIGHFEKSYQVDYACLEGFGYGARGNAIFQLAGLGYMIREYFWNQKITLEIVPPKTLKKWATGNGNAQKDLMLMNVYKRWGVEFQDHNICDAYCMARYIMEKYK